MDKYIMALDLGTTSCRCIIFDKNGRICSAARTDLQRGAKGVYPVFSAARLG